MCLDDFRNVLVSLSPKIFKAVAAMQMKLPTLAMFTQICARHGANDVQPGLIQEVLAGVQKLCKAVHFGPLLSVVMLNVFRMCMRRHDCGSINWGKVHDRSSKLCRSRLPSQVKFQRTVCRLLLLPCIDHPKISNTRIVWDCS